jgi:uncharacterized membrane protein SirB2
VLVLLGMMKSQREQHTNKGAGIALFAGALSFFVSFFTLGLGVLLLGIMPVVRFGPNSGQVSWIMPTIFGISIVVACIAARLAFRMSQNRFSVRRR